MANLIVLDYTKAGAGRIQGLAALLGALCAAVALAGCGAPSGPTPVSAYVPMADGTRLAVDAYVPVTATMPTAELNVGLANTPPPDGRWPAVLRMTTHWRDFDRDAKPGVRGPRDFEATTFTSAGYALVLADARGTGASFGARFGPPGDADAADVTALIDWIVAQPWSSGAVAAWGEGDDTAFAELAATGGHPAVRAAILRFGELDLYAHQLHPGGVPNRRLIAALEREARLLDAGDVCAFVAEDPECDRVARVFHGPRPVDGDRAALAAAIAEHGDGRARWLAAAANAAGRDDVLRVDEGGLAADVPSALWPRTIDAAGGMHRLKALAGSDVAILQWASWLDGGTAASSLARRGVRTRRQHVVLAGPRPGAEMRDDPLGGLDSASFDDARAQFARMIEFLGLYVPVRTEALGYKPSEIDFFVSGRRWTATAWPPLASERVSLTLRQDGRLDFDGASQAGAPIVRPLVADPSSGAAGRWLRRVGSPVEYLGPDPGEPAAAVFTSEPFAQTTVIAGRPSVDVTVAIDRPDGIVHAYLEVVDADGRARLISDGGLALAHRALAASLPMAARPEGHTFAMADRQPTPPGEPTRIDIRLWPVAAEVAAGQALRLSLVGGSLAAAPPGKADEATMTVLMDRPAAISLDALALPRLRPPVR